MTCARPEIFSGVDMNTGVTLFSSMNYKAVSGHFCNPVMRTCLNVKLIREAEARCGERDKF